LNTQRDMATIVALGLEIILDIIEEALAQGTTKKAVIALLHDFAEGKDGVLGTADDRLTPEQVVLLESLISSGTVDRLVEKMYTSSWVQSVLKFLFPCLYRK
jgi:hypothetical protein